MTPIMTTSTGINSTEMTSTEMISAVQESSQGPKIGMLVYLYAIGYAHFTISPTYISSIYGTRLESSK